MTRLHWLMRGSIFGGLLVGLAWAAVASFMRPSVLTREPAQGPMLRCSISCVEVVVGMDGGWR